MRKPVSGILAVIAGFAIVVSLSSAQRTGDETVVVGAKGKGLLPHLRAVDSRERTDNESIYRVLERTASFERSGGTIVSLAETIEKRFEIPVRVRVRELEEDGISPEEEYSIEATSEPVGRLLRRVLSDEVGDLAYVVRGGVLWITTTTDADSEYSTQLYDISDLAVTRSDEEVAAFRKAAAHNAEVQNRFAIWKSGGDALTDGRRGGALCGPELEERRLKAVERWTASPFPLPDEVPTRLPSPGDRFEVGGVVDAIVSSSMDFSAEVWGPDVVVIGDRVFLSISGSDDHHRQTLAAIERLREAVGHHKSQPKPGFF